jgi:hypothetical protein
LFLATVGFSYYAGISPGPQSQGFMGKASRLIRKRQSVRREAKSHLIARVESHTAVGHLPWGQAPGGPKISDALAELIRPYSYDDMGIEACRKLACLGVLAWNRAVAPDMVSREEIRGSLESSGTPESESIDRFIDEMTQRKLQLFPDDLRLIVDAEVREQNDGSFYLAAAFAQK